MVEFQFYLWMCYGLAALGVALLSWYWLRRLKLRFLRDMLLGLVILLLYTPWFIRPEQPDLAPAMIILLHEWVFPGDGNQWWGAAAPLAWSYGGFMVLLALSYWIVRQTGLNSKHSSVQAMEIRPDRTEPELPPNAALKEQ